MQWSDQRSVWDLGYDFLPNQKRGVKRNKKLYTHGVSQAHSSYYPDDPCMVYLPTFGSFMG